MGAAAQAARLPDAAGGRAADPALIDCDVRAPTTRSREGRGVVSRAGLNRAQRCTCNRIGLDFAGRACLRRLGEHAAFAPTRAQRLLLALMRRPARQPEDLEGRADAAVGIRKAFRVDLHPQQRGAAIGARRRSTSMLVAPIRPKSCISANGDA